MQCARLDTALFAAQIGSFNTPDLNKLLHSSLINTTMVHLSLLFKYPRTLTIPSSSVSPSPNLSHKHNLSLRNLPSLATCMCTQFDLLGPSND